LKTGSDQLPFGGLAAMMDNDRPVPRAQDVFEALQRTKSLLQALLQERAHARLLDEQDVQILLLRLGLQGTHCCTLDETANLLHKSPEVIRQRQYLALRLAVRDPRFEKGLREYSRLVALPRGLTYYLDNYKRQ
jgi:DNA-directed RNA polymerase sigma subunit (sigma70/sigma32)